ncbi:hypothetical protein ACFQX6_17935 [Streptosporangium lutulentum]
MDAPAPGRTGEGHLGGHLRDVVPDVLVEAGREDGADHAQRRGVTVHGDRGADVAALHDVGVVEAHGRPGRPLPGAQGEGRAQGERHGHDQQVHPAECRREQAQPGAEDDGTPQRRSGGPHHVPPV